MALYGGVLGDAMSDAANAYLKAVVDAPKEREEQRKRELENIDLQARTELNKAKAGYEMRRMSPGYQSKRIVKDKAGNVWQVDMDTESTSLLVEAPDVQTKLKDQNLAALTRAMERARGGKPRSEFDAEDYNDPKVMRLLDVEQSRSPIQATPGAPPAMKVDIYGRPIPEGTPSSPTQPAGTAQPTDRPTTGRPARDGYPAGGTGGGIPGAEKLSPAFLAKAQGVADRLGTNLDDLLRVMSFETGTEFSSGTKNRMGSGATGLIQFTKETAEGLGTTTEKLARMTPEDQLDYVEKHLAPHKGQYKSLQDLFMGVFWPAAVGKSPDTVLFTKLSHPKAYLQNAALDRDGKGHITVGDATAAVMRHNGLPVNGAVPTPSTPAAPGGTTRAAPTGTATTPAPASPDSTNPYVNAWRGRAVSSMESDVDKALKADPQQTSPVTKQMVDALAHHKQHRAGLDAPLPKTTPPPEPITAGRETGIGLTIKEQEDRAYKRYEAQLKYEDNERKRLEAERTARAEERRLELDLRGKPTDEQNSVANKLFVDKKVGSPNYLELDPADRKVVNDVIRAPKLREEEQGWKKMAQPHMDELDALQVTQELVTDILPLIQAGNLGLMGKAQSGWNTAKMYLPSYRNEWYAQAEKTLREKGVMGKIGQAALDAQVAADVETNDKSVRDSMRHISGRSRLQTLSSVLMYAHALAQKRLTGGTQRGIIHTDMEEAHKLFDVDQLFTNPEALMANLQELQSVIQRARGNVRAKVASFYFDPDTKKYIPAEVAQTPPDSDAAELDRIRAILKEK